MQTVTTLPTRWKHTWSLILLLCAAANSSLAQSLHMQPPYDTGDKWTYRHTNKGDLKIPYLVVNQAIRSDADSAWLYEETQDPGAKRKRSIWRFDYKRGAKLEGYAFQPSNPSQAGEMFFDGKAFEDFMQFPLIVGRKYAITRNNYANNGYSKYDAEVEAFEKITTEAGVFDAYRVKLKGWWTRTDLMEAGRPETGRLALTLYFAPAVKKFVKWEEQSWRSKGAPWTDYEIELVKWEPKASLPANFVAAKPATE